MLETQTLSSLTQHNQTGLAPHYWLYDIDIDIHSGAVWLHCVNPANLYPTWQITLSVPPVIIPISQQLKSWRLPSFKTKFNK